MIANKLSHYFPDAKWNMTGETYGTLEWFGPDAKPTEAELDALAWPPARDLAKEREEANIPKAEFVLGLINLGILQPEDALASSKGNWPAPMLAFLDYLTPEQATQAQIEWATRTEIWRTNTFVLSLASFLGLSDQTVDALFGIEP